MKILIVSDTHKRHNELMEMLDMVQPIDMLIHLGDAEGEEDYIEFLAQCPVEMVAGNNDFFSNLPHEKMIQIGKYRALLTHGHYYGVNMGLAEIKEEAAARRCDIVMFGHTHRPVVEYGEEVIALNPGSIAYPRQEGRKSSAILMDTDAKRDTMFDIIYL